MKFFLVCFRRTNAFAILPVMLNVRRFPGILFRYKIRLGLFLAFVTSAFYLMHRLGFVCTNHEVDREIRRLCELYKSGEAVGNLCVPLCIDYQIHSASCISQHSKKQLVFTAKWNERLIVIKSSESNPMRDKGYENLRNFADFGTLQNESGSRTGERDTGNETPEAFPKHYPRGAYGKSKKEKKDLKEVSEAEFEGMIRTLVSDRLNMTLTSSQLDELKYLELKNKFLYSDISDDRKVERVNVFGLLQSREYLLSRLFADRNLFPQLLGTCGHFYGVEFLETPRFSSLFTLDDKAEWSERMKLAVSVMEFVEEVETNFPDALHLCDVHMNHLGVSDTGRIKFLDLDLVFMKNVLDRILRSGQPCKEHKDCDLFDCKSACNLKENVCDSGVTNDNLQSICEKIFIGWTMSGKFIVPGLLMSEYTPASLSALLRLCAENGREPVGEDLRQRLYTTLTEMHQILVQKLLTE